jgi:hypothetical protein
MALKVPLFPAGKIVATPGAMDVIEENGLDVRGLLRRHLTGDDGDVCQADKEANQDAIENGYRVLSVYKVTPNQKVYIITEADRSATTLLLPEEY